MSGALGLVKQIASVHIHSKRLPAAIKAEGPFKYLSAVMIVRATPPPAVPLTHTHKHTARETYRGGGEGTDAYLSLYFSPLPYNVRTIFT